MSEFINMAFFIDVDNDNNRASFSVIDIFYLASISDQLHEVEKKIKIYSGQINLQIRMGFQVVMIFCPFMKYYQIV